MHDDDDDDDRWKLLFVVILKLVGIVIYIAFIETLNTLSHTYHQMIRSSEKHWLHIANQQNRRVTRNLWDTRYSILHNPSHLFTYSHG